MIIEKEADTVFGIVGGILANHKNRRLTVWEITELTNLSYIQVLAALFLLLRTGKISQSSPGKYRQVTDWTYKIRNSVKWIQTTAL